MTTIGKWHFWLDRGGTFTDVVAVSPDGALTTEKVPSDSINGGIQVLRRHLGIAKTAKIPAARVADIRIGTTIATNMLLERKGERVALLVTRGFADILLIGDQTRPHLFDLDARRPTPLWEQVAEIDERLAADGKVVRPFNVESSRRTLKRLRRRGFTTVAIALMHAFRKPAHEKQLATLALECGFDRVVASHTVSALMKYVPRAHTAVADAYLAAATAAYVTSVRRQCEAGVRLLFMQSNGVLAAPSMLRAVNTILSGPAGGAIAVSALADDGNAIGLDMGGTSTDICLSDAAIRMENQVAGVPLFVPMLDIHTVAAGGGSIAHHQDGRLRVGPHSAGASPGPACYRNGGPLTITDCNVLLGKLQPHYFPAIFGGRHNLPLDKKAVEKKFAVLDKTFKLGGVRLAESFLHIAVEQVAAAIRRISTARGVDPAGSLLNCFGGAAGQHACMIAAAVGCARVRAQRQASVLSAWGIGAAAVGAMKSRSVETSITDPALPAVFVALAAAATAELPTADDGAQKPAIVQYLLHCRYEGVDTALPVMWKTKRSAAAIRRDFEQQYRQLYGYHSPDKTVAAAVAEVRVTLTDKPPAIAARTTAETLKAAKSGDESVFFNGRQRRTPFYDWDKIPPHALISGPAVVHNRWNTVIIDPQWRGRLTPTGDLLLENARLKKTTAKRQRQNKAAMMEIMNSRFMFVAEQMGEILRKTAMSVNIRERLDFSCALFDGNGGLVANAPHIPVHLGSMSESVRHLRRVNPPGFGKGDVFMLNSPYHGGTHLPDITVVRAGWMTEKRGAPDFYVAARGHHADVGGVSPGSMPAASRHIGEEGVLLPPTPVVVNNRLMEESIQQLLQTPPYPARSPVQNIADLRAQIAALASGVADMRRTADEFGAATVRQYLRAVQTNAAQAARRLIQRLPEGGATMRFDDGAQIQVAVRIDRKRQTAVFDFTGTSKQHAGNFNAPRAVTRAAVIYCLRLLLGEDIPLNDGLLRPVRLLLPKNSMLNPSPPAAVAAGNVEVSQHIVDAVLAAVGAAAAGQGTCNNLTIGVGDKQYYETICGGMGASANCDGAAAVQVHMTNSRASDPEVFEWNYPLRLEQFAVRHGSGGGGRRRGGDGAVRHIRFLRNGEANILSSRRRLSPPGLCGGNDGKRGRNHIIRSGGGGESLAGCDSAHMRRGDVLVIETPGGGGFGATD